MRDLRYLEGRRLCVVFVKVADQSTGKVALQTLHGRADVNRGKLNVVTSDGASFGIPSTALPNILPNDGTPILKDAEYFVMVKVDPGIGLFNEQP